MSDKLPIKIDPSEYASELSVPTTGLILPQLSIRGGRFHIRTNDYATTLVDENNVALSAIDVVLCAARSTASKVFYDKAYSGDEGAPPACRSIDSEKPDADIPNPPAPECRVCPNNVWGSRAGISGKAAKACRDIKHLIVALADDLACETYGAPLHLIVPTMSLRALTTYNNSLMSEGLLFFTVVTRLSFVPHRTYPELMFTKGRTLTLDELYYVNDIRQRDDVRMVLQEAPKPLSPLPPRDAAPKIGKPKPTVRKRAARPEPKPEPKPKVIDATAEPVEPEQFDLGSLFGGAD